MHIKIINKLSWLNCLPAVLFTISQHLHTCKVKVQEERRQIFDVNRLAPLCSAHSTPSKHQGHTELRRIINAQITLTKCFPQIITSILANLKLYLASFHFKFFADTTTCDVTLTECCLENYGKPTARAAFLWLPRTVRTRTATSVVLETSAHTPAEVLKACVTSMRQVLAWKVQSVFALPWISQCSWRTGKHGAISWYVKPCPPTAHHPSRDGVSTQLHHGWRVMQVR